jgi:cholesterol transport system auxiliary component
MKVLRPTYWASLASVALMLALLAACATPDKPARATLYDFGPPDASNAAGSATQLTAIALPEVEASGSLDNAAMLYRLGYADANELRPYANARWSAPPAQLVRQRLRQQLGRDRPVLDFAESAALARSGGVAPRVLRIDLEEFSQLFESQAQSSGLLRLRATLLDNTAAGERLLAQRNFVVQKPAPTPDAAGGVRALTSAVDSAADEIARWLQQVR